jgi:hypothetical protein
MRATIMVILEDTNDKQAIEVKQAIQKAVEKIPKVEVQLNTRE